jgi:hypothetical protein
MYVGRARLFLGIGLLLIPIVVAITLLQWLLFYGIDLVGTLTGTGAGAFAALALAIGTTLTLFGLTLVQAATACALVELDAGETVGVRHAYRAALRRAGPLLGATAILVVVWLALSATAFLIPVAIWLAIRWSLLACTCQLEGASSRGALRGSARLVSGRWLRTGSLVGISGAVALLAGPLLGALLIFATDAPLALLNLVAGGVYALAMPFVALVTAYVYFDARGRDALEAVERPDVLPAEYRLAD